MAYSAVVVEIPKRINVPIVMKKTNAYESRPDSAGRSDLALTRTDLYRQRSLA